MRLQDSKLELSQLMAPREQEKGSSSGQGLRKPPQEMKVLKTSLLVCLQDPSHEEAGRESTGLGAPPSSPEFWLRYSLCDMGENLFL